MACGVCNGIGAVEDSNGVLGMCPLCAGAASRLSTALDELQWGPSALAAHLSMNERSVRYWLTGRNPVPERVLDWLDELIGYIRDHPPPKRKAPPGGPNGA